MRNQLLIFVLILGLTSTVHAQIESGKTYKIYAKHSGKIIVVKGKSADDGANIVQTAAKGSYEQIWKIEDTGDGYYKLTAVHSGKVLDVRNGDKKNETNVQQYTSNNTDAQRWKIELLGDGYYKLTAKHSGKVLDVRGGVTTEGADVQQYTWNGTDAQRWKIVSESSDNTSNTNTTNNTITLPDEKTGKVKFYNPVKNFGSITPDDGSADIIVYYTDLLTNGITELKEGDKVSYYVHLMKGKPHAIKISIKK